MGSASAFHLARRGWRVLGLERFDVVHSFGSSHGLTRIIRLAYAEHPSYVPLLRRAYELWRQLENSAGERLLVVTGGLDVGPDDAPLVARSVRPRPEPALPHALLRAAGLGRPLPRHRPA